MGFLRTLFFIALATAVAAVMLVVANPAPTVPAISTIDAANMPMPYVIKLHARWSPVCMMMKSTWETVQKRYAGRVRFVVFDFTTNASTEASRTEATRLGLDQVFNQFEGETGAILVVDGVSKELRRAVRGSRNEQDYYDAIDAGLGVR